MILKVIMLQRFIKSSQGHIKVENSKNIYVILKLWKVQEGKM